MIINQDMMIPPWSQNIPPLKTVMYPFNKTVDIIFSLHRSRPSRGNIPPQDVSPEDDRRCREKVHLLRLSRGGVVFLFTPRGG